VRATAMIVIIDYLIVFLVAIIAIPLPDMHAVYSGGAFRCGLNMRNRGRNNLLDSPFYY
jgi:hypothetical protein